MPGRPTLPALSLALIATVAAACGGAERQGDVAGSTTTAPAATSPAAGVGTTAPEPPDASSPVSSVEPPAATPSTTTTIPAAPVPAEAPPALPPTHAEPVALAREIETTERAIRDPATPAGELPELAHRQQLAYRTLSRNPAWDAAVLAELPDDLRPVVTLNVSAPREALGMFGRLPTTLPAWRIVEPEPPEALLSYYREGERLTGVDWEVLAAINLVETGMGRIQGLSSAGAQGPMQFMPATWERWGEGDVNAPRDAILAAARYLADRGAPADYDKAIWAYNNHANYVRAVKAYAEVMRADERAFTGYYHWQIHHYSEAGDLWLRAGYDQPEPVAAVEWAVANPDRVAGPPPPPELLDR